MYSLYVHLHVHVHVCVPYPCTARVHVHVRVCMYVHVRTACFSGIQQNTFNSCQEVETSLQFYFQYPFPQLGVIIIIVTVYRYIFKATK
jgi:hypothetical protein